MNLQGVPVLVTGGTGFLGSRLVEKLMLEYQADVRVLVHDFSHASRIARFPLKIHKGGIEDRAAVDEAVRGCSLIFHCAYDFVCALEGETNTNLLGARNVAAAALRQNARLIHVSTVDVYGWPAVEILEETTPRVLPQNQYGRIKCEIEKLLLNLHQRDRLAVTVLQPAVVYGPFAGWTIHPIRRLQKKEMTLIDGGEGVCNPVYVDDVVQALLRAALEIKAVGETFLISGKEPISWRQYIGYYEEMLGAPGTISVASKTIEDEWKKKERENQALRLFLRLLRDPRTKAKLQGIPAIKRIMRVMNRRKQQTQEMTELPASTGAVPLELKEQLPLYCTRARISIEKARRILGFEPKFDLQKGMALTRQFLSWANLL